MFPCEPTNLSLKCHPAELRGLCIKGICDGSNMQVITANNPLTVIMTFEALIKHKINKWYKVIKISKLEMMWVSLRVQEKEGRSIFTPLLDISRCAASLGKKGGSAATVSWGTAPSAPASLSWAPQSHSDSHRLLLTCFRQEKPQDESHRITLLAFSCPRNPTLTREHKEAFPKACFNI